MRLQDEPVEVGYLTRKIPRQARSGESPALSEMARVFGASGSPLIPQTVLPGIRQVIGKKTRLWLEEPIGAGGTGVVFIGRHETLPVRRAIKVMYYAHRADRRLFLETLKGSLATVARLRHPGLICIHDAVTTSNYAYVVMDLHNPDRNLRSSFAFPAARRNPTTVLEILERILDTLAFCHSSPADVPIRGSRGVFVHGDLKAENVLLDYRGDPIVTDWLIPNLGDSRNAGCFPYWDTRAYGTPMYMPPEQHSEGLVTPASDVWNFGVLAYEVITGVYPFESERDIGQGSVMPLLRFAPFAPAWLEKVLQHCLLPDYRQRPRDGGALLEEWRRLSLRPEPRGTLPTSRPSVRRVFLSSTFRDLAAERAAVRQALERLGAHCIAMEESGARSVTPRDACLAEVERADLLVLVIGQCYGSRDEVSGLSMTRMEYDYAHTLGIPVLAYVRRHSTGGGRSGLAPAPEAEVEPEVQEFMAALDRLTYSSFSGPEDLAIQVVCDVARLTQPSR